MPRMGFEPTIPVFKRVKIFHALDLAATVIGHYVFNSLFSATALKDIITNDLQNP
jgi:hypothetical protein